MSESSRQTQATISATNAYSSTGGEPLAQGATVGRYVVLSRIGSGGMGVVHVAYDPKLDRNVALKLLHATGAGAQARLLREAQALAKLSHPNIVAVHDVGTIGERIWIAMEFVAGKTLGDWLRERPRPWRAVLAVMTAAGRGLAEAHAAGLVHRDFKPDNVMLGEDGRVRVMDFGLARATNAGRGASSGSSEQVGVSERDSVAGTSDEATAGEKPLEATTASEILTRTGALTGTPAYMAPEQFAGKPAGIAADQFAFCVTLWEALFGERPFRSETIAALATEVLEGRRRPPPTGVRVPTWVRKVCEQGLARDEAFRWPTMQALLDALERGQARVRSRRVLGGVGTMVLAAALGLGSYALDERRRIAACEEAGASIASVWNDDVRADLRAALLSTGASYAETTADRVVPWLDAQAQAWRDARTQTCLDGDVRVTWSPELLDASLWCLDERWMELEALVAELLRVEANMMPSAVMAAAGLSPIAGCRDSGVLGRLPSPPAERRDEVRELRAGLSRARALGAAGRLEDALELVRALLVRAEALGWSPLVASVRTTEAGLLDDLGAYDEAARVGVDAYHLAVRAGAWDVAVEASTALIMTSGDRRVRHAEALSWARHAKSALVHAGDVAGLREAERLHGMAVAYQRAGEYEHARALYERLLSIREETLGPDHPTVAATLNNLANALDSLGARQEALTRYERALLIKERAFGPDHPVLASTLAGLGDLHLRAGDLEAARPLFERSHSIREEAFGPEHPRVGSSLDHLASVYLVAEDLEKAVVYYERALAIREASLGPEHPHVGESLGNLAHARRIMGEQQQARHLLERALRIMEKALGADHPDLTRILSALGQVCTDVGEVERARVVLERAVVIGDRYEGTLAADPNARFRLAKLLALEVEERERARRLAEQALDGAREAGVRAKIEGWLAAEFGP